VEESEEEMTEHRTA